MRLTTKTAAAVACLAFAAVPAVAGADKPDNPGSQGQGHAAKPNKGQHGQGHSQRCKKAAHAKGYVVSGTYGADGAYAPSVAATDSAPATVGSLSFTVTRTNHHATGATSPFSFTDAKVTFDSPTATGPVAGDDVKVIGKILVAKKGCTDPTTGQVTIRKIVFSAPDAATTDDPTAPAAS